RPGDRKAEGPVAPGDRRDGQARRRAARIEPQEGRLSAFFPSCPGEATSEARADDPGIRRRWTPDRARPLEARLSGVTSDLPASSFEAPLREAQGRTSG